jgi:hypothetical protein
MNVQAPVERKPESRKVYSQPKLIIHGTLAELTKGGRYTSEPENDYSNVYIGTKPPDDHDGGGGVSFF